MALDHYISQVHLKNFYSPDPSCTLPLHAICKHTLKQFSCLSSSVCRIEGGNTNSYLGDPRLIEKFIKKIESRYNWAIGQLEHGFIDKEVIYVIAGWIAYVQNCSPGGSRIFTPALKHFTHETILKLEKSGDISPPPQHLQSKGNSLSELIERGHVDIEINPKYPQSIGIRNALNIAYVYGNFTWDVLINPFNDSPFFTSDYPLALELQPKSTISNIIVPLSPKIALRINTKINQHNDKDYSFHKLRRRILTIREVQKINTLIVRCAERYVFFNYKHPWILSFVKKHMKYHIGMKTIKVRHPNGSSMELFKVICLRDDNKDVTIEHSSEQLK